MAEWTSRPPGWTTLNEMQADQAYGPLRIVADDLLRAGVEDAEIVNELSRQLRKVTDCSRRRVAELEALAWWIRRARYLDKVNSA